MDDAAQHPAIVDPLHAAPISRQQWLDPGPLCIRKPKEVRHLTALLSKAVNHVPSTKGIPLMGPDLARGYQVNGLNQYTSVTYAGAPNWSYEHDPNGNLKRSVDLVGPDTTSFTYDVENRLVSASGKANATLVYARSGACSR